MRYAFSEIPIDFNMVNHDCHRLINILETKTPFQCEKKNIFIMISSRALYNPEPCGDYLLDLLILVR